VKVKDIMTRDIVSVRSNSSAEDAARVMKEKNVGTVLVIDGNEFKGLVTDRAIVTRVIGDAKDAKNVQINHIMTKDVVTCDEESDVMDAARKLGEKKIRRCPVINDRRELVGVLSMADVAHEMRPTLDSIFDELSKAAK
jgi:CBS domain-containing protein